MTMLLLFACTGRLDLDGDGLAAFDDCDDADPGAGGGREVAHNGRDDDCDAGTPDGGANPCGDREVPYNGLDDDCDPSTPDDDLDGDGDPGATDPDDGDPGSISGCGPPWEGDLADDDVFAFCRGWRCRGLVGSVEIVADDPDRVDLSDLACLSEVSGDLEISSPSLASLAGLEQLAMVGGDLSIRSNEALPSLAGLDGLTTVGGRVWIWDNPLLTSLEGLGALASLEGIEIESNDALTSLEGLESIDDPFTVLAISGNGSLSTLDGLAPLRSLGELQVWSNPLLVDVDALDAVTVVGGDVWLGGGPGLFAGEPLPALVKVYGFLEVGAGAGEGEVRGFASLTDVDEQVRILGDEALTTIHAFPVLEEVGALVLRSLPGLRTIEGFDALEAVHGPLELRELPALEALPAFPALTQVTENLVLCELDAVTVFDGFPALTTVGGLSIGIEVDCAGNATLVSIPGLDALEEVDGDYALSDNPVLTDASGLLGVSHVGGSLTISDNPALPADAAAALAAAPIVDGEVEVSENGP